MIPNGGFMKKALQLFGLFLVVSVIIGVQKGVIYARITGTQPTNADIWCVGPSGAEVCVDASGNTVPTTDNDAASGTSSLRWSDVQALDATFGDDVTVTDALTVNGNTALGNAATDTVIVTGQTALYARTSTQLSTLAPTASGYLVINITKANVCMSTGTGTGAWIAMTTTTVNAAENWIACY